MIAWVFAWTAEVVLKLYHYTSVTLAEGIFNSNLKGSVYRTQKEHQVGPCIWLTTSARSDGHGLLTGEQLTQANVDYLNRIGQPPKNRTSQVKTAIRITVDSEKLAGWGISNSAYTGLIQYEKFSRTILNEDPIWRKYMGLSAVHYIPSLSDRELQWHYNNTATKEKSWFLFFGAIPVELFEEVAYKTPTGFEAYDFEKHGRGVFVFNGLEVVSPALLAEIRELFPPLNQFDTPHAAVYCTSEEARPLVAFQAQGRTWYVDLTTFEATPRLGELPANISEVIAWTKLHHAELMRLWPAAVMSYNRFYPDKPASLG